MSAIIDPIRSAQFDEDLLLVDRFVTGDRRGFEELYAKYHEKVSGIARGVLLDADEAADAVQEVFTLVYRHLPRFDRRSKFSTWLFRIAVNRSIQEARKNRYKSRIVELQEAADKAVSEVVEDSDPKIYAVLARLHPADRALITLFYWEEMSLQEIADSLGCNVNAAKTRLYRARERFRVLYESDA